jgi:negative regulator of sigma E activity
MPKLIVACRNQDGFIRAGQRWSPTPQEVDVSEKIAAILKAEPMLVVVDAPPSAQPSQQPSAPQKQNR